MNEINPRETLISMTRRWLRATSTSLHEAYFLVGISGKIRFDKRSQYDGNSFIESHGF